VADKRCENGHFIDESWDLCPYCPQEEGEPEIPVVRPRAAEPVPAMAAHSGPPSSPVPAAAVPQLRPVTAHAPRAVRADGTSPSALAVPPPAERTVAASRQDLSGAAKRYVVGWLVALSGSVRGESYAVRLGRNVIGRDRRSDIVVNDDQASSHHADLVFRPDEKRFILMDHNSTNGTYVNEIEIEPRKDLGEKDVIRIGSHRFLFMPLCHDGFHWDGEGLLK
jgi:hypothetical protein